MHSPDLESLLYKRLIIRSNIKRNGRVASNLFKLPSGEPDCEISVDLASMTTPQECVNRPQRTDMALGEIELRFAEGKGFAFHHDPDFDCDPPNMAHHLLKGENDEVKCRLLADHVRIIPGVASDGVSDEDFVFAFTQYGLHPEGERK